MLGAGAFLTLWGGGPAATTTMQLIAKDRDPKTRSTRAQALAQKSVGSKEVGSGGTYGCGRYGGKWL